MLVFVQVAALALAAYVVAASASDTFTSLASIKQLYLKEEAIVAAIERALEDKKHEAEADRFLK